MKKGDRVNSQKLGAGIVVKKYIDQSVLVSFDVGLQKKYKHLRGDYCTISREHQRIDNLVAA
jgi:hypothetical protein